MIFKRKIYFVDWEDPALFKLRSLFDVKLAEKIYKEVNKVLSENPYGKFKDIKVNVEGWKTNIKPLKEKLEGSWRIRIGDYRIVYKVEEGRVLVTIFEFGSREGFYEEVALSKDF